MHRTTLILCLVGSVSLAGCGGGSSSRAASTAPSVTMQTPSGIQTGDVSIVYSVIDFESELALITVEYSTDGGTVFTPATDAGPGAGSEGLVSLASSPPPGILHLFVWDSASDLPSLYLTDVRIMITARDTIMGNPDLTGPFVLDNNTRPQADVQTPPGPYTGAIQIDYDLTDPESDPADVTIEFSTSGGTSYLGATESPGPPSEGTAGLATSPLGTPHVFVWDSAADLPACVNGASVVVRVTPRDYGPGTPGICAPFSVSTNGAPRAVPQTPPSPSMGAIRIDYELFDADSDPVDIAVEYSLDVGVTFQPATETVGAPSEGTTGLATTPSGTPHVFVWDSLLDLPAQSAPDVRIRVTPSDCAPGNPGLTGQFSISSNGRPQAILQQPPSPSAGDIQVDYDLLDAESDLVDLQALFSTDGGISFQAATDTGLPPSEGTVGLMTSVAGTPHIFVWDSMADLGPTLQNTVRLRFVPSDPSGPGPAGETLDFVVDNGARPGAIVQTPPSPSTGGIQIDYDLVDPNSDLLDILVEYSTDAGVTYQGATETTGPPSEGVVALTSSPSGVSHVFVWDSSTNVGPNLRSFVRIQITPSDPMGTGALGETLDFTVDNTVAADWLYSLVIPLDPLGPNSVSGYDIAAAGGLTLLPGSPYPSGGMGRQLSAQSALVASPLGDFIFASHNESLQIEVYATSPTGDLTPVAGSPFSTVGGSTTLSIHQSGKFLYVSNSSDLEGYYVDPATGALIPIPGSPFAVGSSLRHMSVHPRGDFLYTGHMFGADAGVKVHDVDPSTGVITSSSALPLPGGRPGKLVLVDPQGLHLFCADLDAGIYVADIDSLTGALTLVPGSPYGVGAYLAGMTTTVQGDYLYVSVGLTGSVLQAYRVETWGGLTAVPGSPYSTIGDTSIYLRTDAVDRFLFITSRVTDDIRVFDINPTDGSFTQVAGSPFANSNPGGRVGPVLPFP